MRKRAQHPEFSLFPFLAVLVCVMGALVLLLLATTRQMRRQAVARTLAALESQTASATPEPAPVLQPEAPTIDPDFEPEPKLRPESREIPLAGIFAPEVDASPELQQIHRRAAQAKSDLQLAVAAVTRIKNRLTRVRWEQQQAGLLSRQHATEMTKLETQKTDLDQQLDGLRARKELLELEKQEADKRIGALARRLTEVQDKQPSEDSRFAIVPYEGWSGSSRRPIVIECLSRSIRFPSENVELTAADLEGFDENTNPLLSGTVALVEYWRHKGDQGRPYVMLIIRPEGAESFYAARQLLGTIDGNFGYELVSADMQLAWPESDPQAKKVLESAVNSLLQRSPRPAENTPRESWLTAGADGRFVLAEIEEIRNPTRKVLVGGKEFARTTPPRPPQGRKNRRTTISPPSTASSSPDDTRLPSNLPDFQTPPNQQFDSRDLNDLSDISNRTPQSPQAADPGHAHFPRADSPDLAHQNPASSASPPSETSPGTPLNENEPLPFDPPSGFLPPASESVPNRRRIPRSDSPDSRTPQFRNLQNPRDESTRRDFNDQRWNFLQNTSRIPVQRQLTIHVNADTIRVGSQPQINAPDNTPLSRLEPLLFDHAQNEVDSWGTAPAGGEWQPQIRFQVAPGGLVRQMQLQKIVAAWGLNSHVDYVWDEPSPRDPLTVHPPSKSTTPPNSPGFDDSDVWILDSPETFVPPLLQPDRPARQNAPPASSRVTPLHD